MLQPLSQRQQKRYNALRCTLKLYMRGAFAYAYALRTGKEYRVDSQEFWLYMLDFFHIKGALPPATVTLIRDHLYMDALAKDKNTVVGGNRYKVGQ